MIIDKHNTLSELQAVTAAAASTDYIDLGAARDIGMADGLQVVITVGTTVTSGGSSTVTFQLQTDDNTSFSSATTVMQSAAIAKASLVAGYQIFLPIPIGTNERYLRLYYNVATADLTAGTFSAAVTTGVQKNVAYPDAI